MIILYLILYNDNDLYNQMRDILSDYLNHLNVFHFFYCYDENIKSEYVFEGNILRIRGKESFIPGISQKTVKAIEICLKFDFDYLVRSNVSTILDYRLLDYYLKKHDINYGGPEILISWRHVKKYGFESIGFKFATGGCIILSKNMAQLLINNKKDIDYDFIDDVTIALFYKKHYICVEKLKGNYISVYNSKCSYPNAIYYRNKRKNRTEDITFSTF